MSSSADCGSRKNAIRSRVRFSTCGSAHQIVRAVAFQGEGNIYAEKLCFRFARRDAFDVEIVGLSLVGRFVGLRFQRLGELKVGRPGLGDRDFRRRDGRRYREP